MKLKFFNATKKDVEEQKYDIFIGISLGVLKPLTKETAKEYIEWALKNTKNKVLILRWNDIWDKRKEKIKEILKEEYKSNKEFKEQVQFFLKKHSDKRNKDLDKEKLDYLSQYILYELSTLLDGIEYKNEKYRLLLYPTFESSGMSEVVTKIENGKIFPNLKKKLNLAEKTAM